MSVFQDLQASHEALLRRQQANEAILDDVKAYIERVRTASSQVAAPRERDQLRANLRYWAGYVFDQEKVYPNVDLLPGPATSPGFNPTLVVAIITLLGVIIVATFVAPRLLRPLGATPTSGAITPVGATSTPVLIIPTLTPAKPTFTPLPTDTPTASPTPTPEVFAVQLAAPQDGQDVGPGVVLSITYSNLQPGYSIHILTQTVSASGKVFPFPDFFTVPVTATSGTWSTVITLGQGAELERPQKYKMRLTVATTDNARAYLDSVMQQGLGDFEQLTDDFRSLPQTTVTVSRGAYREIKGVRLLYKRDVENNYELFVSGLEGEEAQQLTHTRSLLESQASLSPDGKQIVFVGQEVSSNKSLIYGLWRMDSGGQNPVVLLQEPGAVYERPLWSPDGHYIAYSAIVPEITGGDHKLFLYDTVAGTSRQLQTGPMIESRFPSWMPDSQTLVFSAYRAAGSQIVELFKIDRVNGSVAPLTITNPGEKTQPAVSPDGQKVAYVGYPDEAPSSNRDIFVLDLTTGESKQLTTHSALDWFPAWSPDGTAIYFESWRTGTFIWKMDADGSNQHQITRGDPTTRPFVGQMTAFLPLSP